MLSRKKTWVLVGDGVKAQLYSLHAIPLRLTPVPSGRFRSGKARTRDLESELEDKFVARVAAATNTAASAGKFDALILVAPPRALAAYRQHLDPTAKTKIKLQVRSEWTKLGIKEIEEHLAARLPL